MGRRLPILKAKELIRVLRALGFIFMRQKGSHAFYQHPVTGKSTVVSIHPGEDIDRSLLKAILQETNVDPEEFLKYL
ncbi:addiction module toxin, HicA family [Candidatus Uhrbacteria bacterium]|nr:addiction module toxin, HicA family [Candidatus Uhrbacteria bacterium]